MYSTGQLFCYLLLHVLIYVHSAIMDETQIQIMMHGLFYLKEKLGFKRVLWIIVESNNILNDRLSSSLSILF